MNIEKMRVGQGWQRLLWIIAALAGVSLGPVSAMAKEPSVAVTDAWARPTMPGQAVAVAYMTLTSPADAKLVKIESAAAAEVQIHSMTMKEGVMQMREMAELELPAGQPVRLEPGGLHLMLVQLKGPLKTGQAVPLKLTIARKGSTPTTQTVSVPVDQNRHGASH